MGRVLQELRSPWTTRLRPLRGSLCPQLQGTDLSGAPPRWVPVRPLSSCCFPCLLAEVAEGKPGQTSKNSLSLGASSFSH